MVTKNGVQFGYYDEDLKQIRFTPFSSNTEFAVGPAAVDAADVIAGIFYYNFYYSSLSCSKVSNYASLTI